MSQTIESKSELHRDLLVVLALSLPALYVFPYFHFLQHANEMPRLFVTEALAEQGNFAIDRPLHRHGYRKKMDLSRSLCLSAGLARAASRSLHRPISAHCREHYYSNKAPGPSVVAVPFHWAAGAWARLSGRKATLADRLWWSRFGASWLATLLALLALASLGRRLGLRSGPRHAMLLAYGLGSMALVYSVQFMSHQLAAAGAIISLALLTRPNPVGRWALVGAGLAAGLALAADYQSALLLAIVAVYGLWRIGLRRGLWALTGGLPMLGLLGLYHWSAFGWPTWTGYEFLVDQADLALHVRHPLGLVGPRSGPFQAILWSPREGLLFLSPWLGLAVFGLARLLAKGRDGLTFHGSVGAQDMGESSDLPRRIHQSILGFGFLLVVLVVLDHAASGMVQRHLLGWFARFGLRPATGSTLMVCALGWWSFGWLAAVMAFGFRREWLGPFALPADAVVVAAAFVAPIAHGLAGGPESLVALWTLVGSWQALGGAKAGGRTRQAALVLLAWNFGLLVHLLPWQGIWPWAGWFLVLVWAMETARSRRIDAPALVPSRDSSSPVASGASPAASAFVSDSASAFALGLVGLLSGMVYLWFVSSISFWHGGWQVGPRYLAVCLPVLALAAGKAMDGAWNGVWSRAGVGGLVFVGMFAYVTTAAVFPHYPKSFENPLFDLIWYLMVHGHVARNLGARFLGLSGVASLVPLFVYVGILAVAVLSGWTAAERPWRFDRRGLGQLGRGLAATGLAAVLAMTILFGYSRLPKTDLQHCCRWIVTMWDREQSSRWDAP